MSIIVAVCKNDQTVVATDSLTTFGDDAQVPVDNSQTSKMRAVGSAIIGASGWAVYDRIMDDFLDDRASESLECESTIFAFFLDLWKDLHEKYPFVNDQAQSRDTPFGDLDSTFLIASRGGIFRVAHDMDVCRFAQYYAIGSGADYALGAIDIMYLEPALSAEMIARRAVETACRFDVHCGGPTEVMSVQTLPPPLPAPELSPGF